MLREAPVVDHGDYRYVVTPVTDGIPEVGPALLREVAAGVAHAADLEAVDRALAPEAMGIHHAAALALATDRELPFVVARKREYGLEGEVSLSQVTGYSESEMFINDVEPGDSVLVLDDLLSTGGTLHAILTALEEIGADVIDVVTVIKKVGENELQGTGHDVKTLINIDVVDGEVVVVDETGDG